MAPGSPFTSVYLIECKCQEAFDAMVTTLSAAENTSSYRANNFARLDALGTNSELDGSTIDTCAHGL